MGIVPDIWLEGNGPEMKASCLSFTYRREAWKTLTVFGDFLEMTDPLDSTVIRAIRIPQSADTVCKNAHARWVAQNG
jgi:hypothetical protein